MKNILIFFGTAFFLSASLLIAQPTPTPIKTISFAEGLRELLEDNATLLESKAAILKFRALKDQADKSDWPQVDILAFATVLNEGRGNSLQYETNYEKWGPYLFAQGNVVWPVFSFGRITLGKKAGRYAVKAASKLHEAKINDIIYEYKKLYLSVLLINKLKVVLDEAQSKMKDALEKAEDLYAEGEGKIQKKDIVRLKIYAYEIQSLRAEWESQNKSATLGLAHLLGRPAPVTVKETEFPAVTDQLPALTALLEESRKHNPTQKALEFGLIARKSAWEMEKKGWLPVFFIGGRVSASYASARDDQPSAFAYDPYNDLTGGVVFGAKWTLDAAERAAAETKAEAEYKELLAKQKEAFTGLPFLVAQAYWDCVKAKRQFEIATQMYKQASGWSISEWTSYTSGLGDAKDLLESLASFYMTWKRMLEAEYNYNLALANLARHTGNNSKLNIFDPESKP